MTTHDHPPGLGTDRLAVHGIEALGQGALGVRSLQEWTAVAREDRVIQESAEDGGSEGRAGVRRD